MAWTIDISEKAVRELRKIDKQTARRIRNELEKIAKLDDPRSKGKALAAHLDGFWRYRIGKYRVICDIKEDTFVILALRVDHRSKIYKVTKHGLNR